MRTLADLEFLNGLRVEREILEEEGEYEEEDESLRKSSSPVKEEPSQEDLEDDDYVKQSNSKPNNNNKDGNMNISDGNYSPSPDKQQTHNTLAELLQQQNGELLDIDPEDLEQIALIYDNIRLIRKKSQAMKGNSDR